ncbi:MAG: Ig-like domain-containing domain, partial [Planctomycetota bacterium]
MAGCTGGSAGVPDDDIGDIRVLTHSPGNGDTLRNEDSDDKYNALNNPTLTTQGAVTVTFNNSLDLSSVINPDDADPQGSRNVRLFFFDTSQGPFDPDQPLVPGVNPPGANVLISATTSPASINRPNDSVIIRPDQFTEANPMPTGQYSCIVELGVRGADGDGMVGQEYFFFFRVGDDNLGPVVVETSPVPGERDVEPDAEIRITMSETLLASTVNNTTLKVNFQPAGTAIPTSIPGFWYTDGGNGPGNNHPAIQLDAEGNPGLSGISPRNGVDLVFKPDLNAFPVNMTAEDPLDPLCTLITDPPRKGNTGFPLGTAINVEFEVIGQGVTDTAGNSVPAGSPTTKFTFETRSLPDPVFAPNIRGAVYYGDTIGVGVIDIDPARTPYLVGPNPARAQNSVVTSGNQFSESVVRVEVPDLVDITTDTRPYTSFYTFLCFNQSPSLFSGNVYAASRSEGGGRIVVIDAFNMTPMGRFSTPSPGGIGLTALGNTGRAAVSNFSANTVTVYDIASVRWYVDPNGALWYGQGGLITAVSNGTNKLILSEDDFEKVFPAQRGEDETSPPGPPVIGTINVGISPTKAKITGLPNSLGVVNIFCPSPILSINTIVCALNAGENTMDFSELTNLNQSQAIEPDLDGVNLSSQPTDVA